MTSKPEGASVLLLSFYESGFQPVSIASAAPYLRQAGFEVRLRDTFLDGLDDRHLAWADYIVVSLPLFQSLEIGAKFFPRLRRTGKPIIAFGQHATLATDLLLEKKLSDWVIRGDWEAPLVSLVADLDSGGNRVDNGGIRGVCARGQSRGSCPPYFHRGPDFYPPDRSGLPALRNYEYGLAERFLGSPFVVGNVETCRGCHHACLYCSVFGAYEKKVVIIPREVVLEDVRACVEQGACHICMVDAEFLNSRTHGLEVARSIHAEFPELSFDFTARADHLLECAEAVEEMVELGLRFVTSAFEFPSDKVMRQIDKEMEVDDCVRAVRLCERLGLGLNPTFLTFNPWTSVEEVYHFTDFLSQTGLDRHLDPLQLETRLYLPKGSPLLGSPALQGIELEEHEFHYEWKHPDPRLDKIFSSILTPPKEGEFRRCCIKC